MNKDLLIIFGEYRTFDVVIKQLRDLDKVDVIVSTWSNELSEEQIDSITEIIPHATVLLHDMYNCSISEYWMGGASQTGYNRPSMMYYHWNAAINHVDETQYEKVILHRTDAISDWHKILDYNLEENTLYCNKVTQPEGLWVNDYLLFGNFSIMKLFINELNYDNTHQPHFSIGKVIRENKILTKHMNIRVNLINDPWDWVTHFEDELSNYCGYTHAIACDSNSNAIRLVLHYLEITNQEIEIPAHTYASVPNQIILSGNTPKFTDIKWKGLYPLGDTKIIDAATALFKNMSMGYEDNYMILSFHLKKILNIGQGGMILTNDSKFNEWARPMIYDGRHKNKMYTEDEFECIGWHMYMSPETAQRGLEIFNSDKIQDYNEPCGSDEKYTDLRNQKIYEKWIRN